MKQLYITLTIALSFIAQFTFAQCSDCTYTYPGTYNGQNLNGNQTVCFTSGTYSGSIGNINGNNNVACISPNATVNWNKDISGFTFYVSGTLNYNGGNFNGNKNYIYVRSGGTLVTGSNVSQLSNVTIVIENGGTMTIGTTNTFSFQNGGGIINDGTINALSPSTFKIMGNVGLENTGSINVTNLEIWDGAPSSGVLRQNTGTITVTTSAYIHGYYINDGLLAVTGSLGIGDGGSNQLINNSVITVNGTTTVAGPMTNNGSMYLNGDFTVTKPITGTNGKVSVTSGTSLMQGDGAYKGTSMTFCDQTTSNNDFRYGATNTYTIDCSAANSPLPLRILSFTAVEVSSSQIYFKITTSEERNVARMELQASNNATNFVTVQNFSVYNTTGPNYYTSATLNRSSYSYYRLAIIDADGSVEYSDIVRVTSTETKAATASIYPNPLTGQFFNLKVSSTSTALINVYTADGRQIYTTRVSGSLTYVVNLPSTVKGQRYLTIQVIIDGKAQTIPVLNLY